MPHTIPILDALRGTGRCDSQDQIRNAPRPCGATVRPTIEEICYLGPQQEYRRPKGKPGGVVTTCACQQRRYAHMSRELFGISQEEITFL